MNSYERLNYNFIQRSIKYNVKEELNKPNPMVQVDDKTNIQGGKGSFNPKVKEADEQSKVRRTRSISDVCINLSEKVEKLPDRVIQYDSMETLTKEDLVGTNFQLDDDARGSRSVYIVSK